MECFAHMGATAIGVCKSCGKAICRECARDLGFAVACSERCVTLASEVESMNAKAKQIYAVGGRKRMPNISLIMFTVFGLLFAGYGAYNTFVRNDFDFIGLGMGSAFLLLSLVLHFQVRDFFKDDQSGNVSTKAAGTR
jgi:hypothetical protein